MIAGGALQPPLVVPISAAMAAMRKFFRENPQVLVLLVICVVLGLGTFIAVLIALAGAGHVTPSGEPSGVIAVAGVLLG